MKNTITIYYDINVVNESNILMIHLFPLNE